MIPLAFTLSALGGCLAGLWLGAWLQRWIDSGRPDITAWGENTALWSEVDWNWYQHCGRHSDPHWAQRQRIAGAVVEAGTQNGGYHPEA